MHEGMVGSDAHPASPDTLRRKASKAAWHSLIDVIWKLLDEDGAPLDRVDPFGIPRAPSSELFQLLVDCIWDFNQRPLD